MERKSENFIYHRSDMEITPDELVSFRHNFLITEDDGEYHLYAVKDV